jgi:hypothetical protein
MRSEAARSGAAPVVLGIAGRLRSARVLKMAPVLTGTYVFITGMPNYFINCSETVCVFWRENMKFSNVTR